ncbi:16S rRNA (cytosine(1402)-N(4))-methyltransferase RsmH [Bacillus sp. FJAT-44742]|uniref:16S rRNA (cytosine(1402)-N(4))-methyltransferase RsmH n=1 Tax=Bacillus sp. FJAT-44742 TaxID=2014005 RepID=UPI000C24B99C|nr:16S rRNA (cytosine(1402)-N(4))-methyltransferase RsmH [Bacillus sp. FJAT-44742]
MAAEFQHETVLLEEAIKGLNVKENGVYVDCTLGGGGHSEAILHRLQGDGHLFAFEQDERARSFANERLAAYQEQLTIIPANFRYLKEELGHRGISKVDGILFDLGVSSPQLDEGERGFSYQHDAPLDMRMDQSMEVTAKDIVNQWPYEELVKVIFRYGEERFAKQIARAIESHRKTKEIQSTDELTEIIKEAIPAPARRKGGHPSKRTFQAIRIAVNDELAAFEEAVKDAINLLSPSGRLCVITFHSLEDRICKQVMREAGKRPELPRGLPIVPSEAEPILELITRKPITASTEELDNNRRARSAKLRIAEKKGDVNRE